MQQLRLKINIYQALLGKPVPDDMYFLFECTSVNPHPFDNFLRVLYIKPKAHEFDAAEISSALLACKTRFSIVVVSSIAASRS